MTLTGYQYSQTGEITASKHICEYCGREFSMIPAISPSETRAFNQCFEEDCETHAIEQRFREEMRGTSNKGVVRSTISEIRFRYEVALKTTDPILATQRYLHLVSYLPTMLDLLEELVREDS